MYAEYEAERLVKRVFGTSPEQIASTVLLAPAKSIVAELTRQLKKPQPFGTWFTGVSGFLEKDIFVTVLDNIRYAPGMGDCVYFLQFAGVRKLIYTGVIGGLATKMEIGDFILVQEAERGDGASKYYSPIATPALASEELIEVIRPFLQIAADSEKHQLFEGRIFTTDSLAAETIDFLTSLQLRDFLGIEMETSTLYVVARCMGMQAVAAHVVSDLPLAGKTLFDKLTKNEKERRASAHSAIVNALTRTIKTLAIKNE
jgi:purine-nucleoside phosphorylase